MRVITYPDHTTNKCPLCDIPELSQATLAEHFTIEHTKSDSSWNTLIDSIHNGNPLFTAMFCAFQEWQKVMARNDALASGHTVINAII